MVESPSPIMTARACTLNRQLLFERRILSACTTILGLGILLWLTSIATESWFIIDGGSSGIYVNHTRTYFLHSHSGLFRTCRTSQGNTTARPKTTQVTESQLVVTSNFSKMAIFRKCKFIEFFPNETKFSSDPSIDRVITNYTRTEVSFSIISLLLMVMGFLFSLYTFSNPRYMFKRLASGIHFIACFSVLVVIEVLMNSIAYERHHMHFVHPRGASYHYGYSYVLAWVVFSINLTAAIAFMVYSRKRKGINAPTEALAMADRPTIIGR